MRILKYNYKNHGAKFTKFVALSNVSLAESKKCCGNTNPSWLQSKK
jgi:hypothetical protein